MPSKSYKLLITQYQKDSEGFSNWVLIPLKTTEMGSYIFFILYFHILFLGPSKHGRGRGGNWPIENQKGYFSGTECQIDLKPGCRFKFLRCLDVYVKN